MFKSLLKYQLVRPVSVGLGGPFSALLSALTGIHQIIPFRVLCPLWGLLLLPLTLLVPVVLPIIFLYAAMQHYRLHGVPDIHQPEDEINASPIAADLEVQDQASACLLKAATFHEHAISFTQFNLGAALHKCCNILFMLEFLYCIILIMVWYGVGYFTNLALLQYMDQARASQTLQIASSGQLAFADSLVMIYSIAALVVLSAILLCFVVTIVSISSCVGRKWVVESVLLKNFFSFAVLFGLCYAVFVTIERYYAHLRMIAVDRLIQGLDYFDPSWLFIGLRAYIAYAFVVAMLLMVMTGLRILPRSWISSKKTKQVKMPS